jgi:hypothetical protein
MERGTSSYADLLRHAMGRLDPPMSIRRLGKLVADASGSAPESERKAIEGYLKGTMPQPERSAIIADVLSAPELRLSVRWTQREARAQEIALLRQEIAELRAAVERLEDDGPDQKRSRRAQ